MTEMQTIKRWFWKATENPVLDTEAFSRLYDETYLLVFRYVYGLSGGPPQEAEDLTAETYSRAWKAREHFKGDRRAAVGWLLRIARNLAVDLSRRRQTHDVDDDLDVESLIHPDPSPEMDVVTREQLSILWGMLQNLPADVREMLVLRYIVGWQVKEIAVHLNMNENTVTVAIKRALKKMQDGWPQLPENNHE